MTDCKTHDFAARFLVGDDSGGKCKICRHLVYRNNYQANKEKILQKAKEYRKSKPEKIIEMRKKYADTIKIIDSLPDAAISKMEMKLRKVLLDIARVKNEYHKLKSDAGSYAKYVD